MGLFGRQRLQIGDGPGVVAEGDQCRRALLDRDRPQLAEPGNLGQRPPLVGEVAERLVAPQSEGRPVAFHGAVGQRAFPASSSASNSSTSQVADEWSSR